MTWPLPLRSSSPAADNVEPTSSPLPEEPALALAAVYGPIMRSSASEGAPLERPFRAPTLSVLDLCLLRGCALVPANTATTGSLLPIASSRYLLHSPPTWIQKTQLL